APAPCTVGTAGVVGVGGFCTGVADVAPRPSGAAPLVLSSSFFTLLATEGAASAFFAPVPTPKSRPQNTPTARPAETTTGTAFDVPRRIGRGMGAAPIGPP